MSPTYIYLIGSLRNKRVPHVGNVLREAGFGVFDEWYGAGERADDAWQEYENIRGRSYVEALYDEYAGHIFDFDLNRLNRAQIGVLLLPAGKSAHIEFGYVIGQGKPGYVLFDNEPPRRDVMYRFAQVVFFEQDALVRSLKERYLHG